MNSCVFSLFIFLLRKVVRTPQHMPYLGPPPTPQTYKTSRPLWWSHKEVSTAARFVNTHTHQSSGVLLYLQTALCHTVAVAVDKTHFSNYYFTPNIYSQVSFWREKEEHLDFFFSPLTLLWFGWGRNTTCSSQHSLIRCFCFSSNRQKA